MIYLIPGIGVDHRVFNRIHLDGFETTVVHWVKPVRNESIEHYAKRLLPQIKHSNPVFIGLSFGGLIAYELAKLFPGARYILISSIASRNELAWYSRLPAFFRMNRLISGKVLKSRSRFIRWFFSVSPGSERKLFEAIVRDTDPDFLYWALDRLLHWEGDASGRLHHIHGEKDRLLPVQYTSADIIIPGAGHFMIVSHGAEISLLLVDLLKKAGISPE